MNQFVSFSKRAMIAAAACVTVMAAIGCRGGSGASAKGNPWFDAARMGGGTATLSAASASGADVNARDRHNRTPLHYAAYERHNDVLTALLQRGAEIDPVDKDGKTPLYMACDRANSQGALALINAGANPNIADERGRTPLWIAAWMGQLQPVQAMLAKGGDPTITDNKGRDAADTAMDRGYPQVAEELYKVRNAKKGITTPPGGMTPGMPTPMPGATPTPTPGVAPTPPTPPAAPNAPTRPM